MKKKLKKKINRRKIFIVFTLILCILFVLATTNPVVNLTNPKDFDGSLGSSINFTASIFQTADTLKNFTFYHDLSGTWSINATRYPELPRLQEDHIPNNINMTGNIIYLRFNNNSDFDENRTFYTDHSGNSNNATGQNFDGGE